VNDLRASSWCRDYRRAIGCLKEVVRVLRDHFASAMRAEGLILKLRNSGPPKVFRFSGIRPERQS
jgi:hypothetical protein